MVNTPIGSPLASTPIMLAAPESSPLAKTFSAVGNVPISVPLWVKAHLGNTDAKIELAAARGNIARLEKFSGAVMVKIAATQARLKIASSQARFAGRELQEVSQFDRSRALSVGACKAQNRNYEIYDYAREEYVAARAKEQAIQTRLDSYYARQENVGRHLEQALANTSP